MSLIRPKIFIVRNLDGHLMFTNDYAYEVYKIFVYSEIHQSWNHPWNKMANWPVSCRARHDQTICGKKP